MVKSDTAKRRPKPKASAAAPKTGSLPALKAQSQLEVKGNGLPEVKMPGLPGVRAVDQPEVKTEKPSPARPPKPSEPSTEARAPRPGDNAPPAGQASDKVKIKGVMPFADAAAQFEKIVAGLTSGEAVVSADNEFITLRPALDVEIEIKAARKKDEERISLKMAWKRGTP